MNCKSKEEINQCFDNMDKTLSDMVSNLDMALVLIKKFKFSEEIQCLDGMKY